MSKERREMYVLKIVFLCTTENSTDSRREIFKQMLLCCLFNVDFFLDVLEE